MFSGSIVALITPMNSDGIDETALRKLVHWHIEQGTHGLVPVGTTGESATLNNNEQRKVLELVVHESGGAVPVIGGAGSNSTQHAIDLSRQAVETGVDALLHAVGYYNKPSQEGVYQHFAALNQATDLPILVYNVPRRTIVDIEPETMGRLAALENIVGIKDASCDLTRPILEAQSMGETLAESFCFLSGEDPLAVTYNVHGGQGCISVTANVAPALCAEMQEATNRQDYARAMELQRKLMPLHQALFLEPSPAGVKFGCSLLGLSESVCRLPIVSLSDESKEQIRSSMRQLELI